MSTDKPGLRTMLRDIGPVQISYGFIAFLFGATGPLAIILSIGTEAGLSQSQLASFVFGVFAINGVLTLGLIWAYRQPLCLFWTIPGTVLIGPAMKQLGYAQVIGAFYATSLLILVLGLSGFAKRVQQWIPMPIVMGMVAGVFLRFGTDVIRALHGDFAIAGTMVLVFLGLSAWPLLARYMPPLIGALLAGILVVAMGGKAVPGAFEGLRMVQPVFTAPEFSIAAMIELVVPLAITILLVQNGQGYAVLTQAGHHPPVTAVTVICGIGGLLSAAAGAVGTCLTGATNGIITSAGPRDKHYATAAVTAALAILFGMFAPTFTRLMLAAPKELIATLAGLAMLRVLLGAFMTSFHGRFALGALVSFLVTVADLPVLNIGAAFWGLVAGSAVSWLLERADFAHGRS
ncbi:MAG: benzoate/H(+) symporter BenE family transporter [Beijerinckiaceae bacterium]